MDELFSSLKQGQDYIKAWPLRHELAPLFIENRIILATQFAFKTMPAVAVVSILLQIIFNKNQELILAFSIALFALSIPFQGLWWLGKRSQKYLPINLQRWYAELYMMLQQAGCAQEPQPSQPRYQHLAQTLNLVFKRLERQCIDRWF